MEAFEQIVPNVADKWNLCVMISTPGLYIFTSMARLDYTIIYGSW